MAALRKGRGLRVDNSFGILGRVMGYLQRMRARILGVILVIMWIRCRGSIGRESTVVAPVFKLVNRSERTCIKESKG